MTRVAAAGRGSPSSPVADGQLPILYLLSVSVRTNDDVLNGRWLPTALYWENWPKVFETIPLSGMLANSWLVAVGAALLTAVRRGAGGVLHRACQGSARKLGTLLLGELLRLRRWLPCSRCITCSKHTGLTNSVLGLGAGHRAGERFRSRCVAAGGVRPGGYRWNWKEAAWLDGLGSGPHPRPDRAAADRSRCRCGAC